MAIVKKGNKILDISSGSLESFLADGFDQIDEQGKVIKRATGGRTVSLAEHNKALEELEKLKTAQVDNEELEKFQKENAELKKEIKSLKGKLTKLEKQEGQKGSDENQGSVG